MTIAQKRTILKKIQNLEADIEELKRCKIEIASTGFASATMSSAGGSKSYTHLNLSELNAVINSLTKELVEYRKMLGADSNGGISKQIYTVYC